MRLKFEVPLNFCSDKANPYRLAFLNPRSQFLRRDGLLHGCQGVKTIRQQDEQRRPVLLVGDGQQPEPLQVGQAEKAGLFHPLHMTGYGYPGTVRELRSIIQASVNLARDRPITLRTLPAYPQAEKKVATPPHENGAPLRISLAEMERARILGIYRSAGHNKTETARRLGLGLSTPGRKLQSYRFE